MASNPPDRDAVTEAADDEGQAEVELDHGPAHRGASRGLAREVREQPVLRALEEPQQRGEVDRLVGGRVAGDRVGRVEQATEQRVGALVTGWGTWLVSQ